MKLAANLSHLWAELPFFDRFDAAGDAGFKAVEVEQPYDVAIPMVQKALARNGLDFLLLNAPGPNYTGGPRGFAAQPGGEGRFDYDLRRAVRYAQTLGAGIVHVLCGDGDGAQAETTLIENLKRGCDTLPEGMALTIEPLKPATKPECVLSNYDQAAGLIETVGASNLGLQFDSFQAHLMTGDAVAAFHGFQPLIRHIRLRDAPAGGAPGTGEIDFGALLPAIANSGYDGWVSAAYATGGRTEKGLGWMADLAQ